MQRPAPAHFTRPSKALSRRYAGAAPGWSDKMRVLGYCDAYLGFLAAPEVAARPAARVIDVGTGTGAMAEAFCAIAGAPRHLTLLDPAPAMLARAEAALARRGIAAEAVAAGLGADLSGPYDTILAAHVIEHFAEPVGPLRHIRALAAPGARLFLVVSKPHWCNAIVWMQWRHRCFRADQIAFALAAAGFALQRTYAFPAGPPSRTSRGYAAVAV